MFVMYISRHVPIHVCVFLYDFLCICHSTRIMSPALHVSWRHIGGGVGGGDGGGGDGGGEGDVVNPAKSEARM